MLEVPNGEDGRWESDVWDGGGASLELEALDGGAGSLEVIVVSLGNVSFTSTDTSRVTLLGEDSVCGFTSATLRRLAM